MSRATTCPYLTNPLTPARKENPMRTTHPILLHDNGRPLRFVIRRMPAFQMEAWLERAAELLPGRPGKAPRHPAALASELLRRGTFPLARANAEQAAALLDEMLAYCSPTARSSTRKAARKPPAPGSSSPA